MTTISEQPQIDEEIDWAAETAEDEAAAQAIAAKLAELEVPEEVVGEVEEALKNDANRVIIVPETSYRVVRGVGHQLLITEFSDGENTVIFEAGSTGLESENEAESKDELPTAA